MFRDPRFALLQVNTNLCSGVSRRRAVGGGQGEATRVRSLAPRSGERVAEGRVRGAQFEGPSLSTGESARKAHRGQGQRSVRMHTNLRSRTTTECKMTDQKLAPVHPGEILSQEFLRPMGISQYRLAKDILVPPRRINKIVQGQRSLTADTALWLAKFFGTSAIFWLNLQARYDLDVQRQRLGKRLREVRAHVPQRHRATAAYRRKAK